VTPSTCMTATWLAQMQKPYVDFNFPDNRKMAWLEFTYIPDGAGVLHGHVNLVMPLEPDGSTTHINMETSRLLADQRAAALEKHILRSHGHPKEQ